MRGRVRPLNRRVSIVRHGKGQTYPRLKQLIEFCFPVSRKRLRRLLVAARTTQAASLHSDNCFNSTLVRLRPFDEVEADIQHTSFNSTLVRLRLTHERLWAQMQIAFQLYTGAIKTSFLMSTRVM